MLVSENSQDCTWDAAGSMSSFAAALSFLGFLVNHRLGPSCARPSVSYML